MGRLYLEFKKKKRKKVVISIGVKQLLLVT